MFVYMSLELGGGGDEHKNSANVFDVCSPILQTICDGCGLGKGVVYEKKSNYSCSHGF